jgi:hypothetical protein
MGVPVVDFSADDWARLLDYFGHCCAYCNRSDVSLQQDHVIPLSQGGAHTPENIVPSCFPCNRDKSDLSLVAWLAKDTFEQAGLPGFGVTPFGGSV